VTTNLIIPEFEFVTYNEVSGLFFWLCLIKFALALSIDDMWPVKKLTPRSYVLNSWMKRTKGLITRPNEFCVENVGV